MSNEKEVLELLSLQKELNKRLNKSHNLEKRQQIIDEITLKYQPTIIYCNELYNISSNNIDPYMQNMFNISMDRIANYLLFAPELNDNGYIKEGNIVSNNRNTISFDTGLEFVLDENGEFIGNVEYDFSNKRYSIAEYKEHFKGNKQVENLVSEYEKYKEMMMDFIKEAESVAKTTNEKQFIAQFNGKNVELNRQKLDRIKSNVGYTGRNCIEIDKSIVSIYEQFYNPMSSKTTNSTEIKGTIDYKDFRYRNKYDIKAYGYVIDLSDTKQVEKIIKHSCLTGVSKGFDKYIDMIDKLMMSSKSTEKQKEIYLMYRTGTLQAKSIDNKAISDTDIAKKLGVSKQYVGKVVKRLAELAVEEYNKSMEEYYYNELSLIQGKTCDKCGETFPATENFFYSTKKVKGGLRNICKNCS